MAKLTLGQSVKLKGEGFKVTQLNPSPRTYKIPEGNFKQTVILERNKNKEKYFLGIGRKSKLERLQPAVEEDKALSNINITKKNLIEDKEVKEEVPIVELITFGDKHPFFDM